MNIRSSYLNKPLNLAGITIKSNFKTASFYNNALPRFEGSVEPKYKTVSKNLAILLSSFLALTGCTTLQTSRQSTEVKNKKEYKDFQAQAIKKLFIMSMLESKEFQTILERGTLKNMKNQTPTKLSDGRELTGITFEKNSTIYVLNMIHKNGDPLLYRLRAGDVVLTIEKNDEGKSKVSFESIIMGPKVETSQPVSSDNAEILDTVSVFFEELTDVLKYQQV